MQLSCYYCLTDLRVIIYSVMKHVPFGARPLKNVRDYYGITYCRKCGLIGDRIYPIQNIGWFNVYFYNTFEPLAWDKVSTLKKDQSLKIKKSLKYANRYYDDLI